MENLNIATLLSLVGVLVVVVNIITQVLKKVTWDKLPTNVMAVVISMVVTLLAFFAYCQINSVAITWYLVAGAVVLGFLVAYAAMFGFDKLREALAQIGENKN